jgi:hypothetical protein
MGALGEFDYPDITVSQAVDIIRVIEERNIERLDVLANAIGHKGSQAYRGGAFRSKLSALARYGFVTGRLSELHLSDLAKSVLHPRSDAERDAAIAKAVLSVPLVARLHEKLKGNIPDDFWVPLYDSTSVDQKLVKEHSAEIRRLYADAVKYLSPGVQIAPTQLGASRKEDRLVTEADKEIEENVPPDMMLFRSGAIHVTLPVSPQNVKVLIHLLESLSPAQSINNT